MAGLFRELRGNIVSKANGKSLSLFVAIAIVAGVFGGPSDRGFAQTAGAASAQGQQQGVALRDGKNDFDFNLGVWHTHIQRVLDPFSG